MKQRWTLNVEGFGKIEKASVRVSPLMIFVGENNSGKSYLMSLLWGIIALGEEIFPHRIPTGEAYRKCDEWFLGQLKENSLTGKEIVIDHQARTLITNWFNELLQDARDVLSKRIFNGSIQIRNVHISDFSLPEDARVLLTNEQYPYDDLKEKDYFLVFFDIPKDLDREVQERYETFRYMCLHLIFGELFPATMWEPLYLPASRTGFMLTYKMLAKKSIKYGFGATSADIRDKVTLTLPVTKFLSELVGLETETSHRYQSVISFLEQEILQGEIRRDDSPIPNYLFKPAELNEELAMHLTSSLVSEITPIILFLQSTSPFGLMIIEEPEAHLHLEMQRKMAQAIVRLVNLGLPVWITTHSDTMFQQFNNLITLHNHPNRDELAQKHGYEELDFLNSSLANAYQFKVQNRKTTVEALKITEYGFSAPTFNKSIINLRKETLEFQEFDTDAE